MAVHVILGFFSYNFRSARPSGSGLTVAEHHNAVAEWPAAVEDVRNDDDVEPASDCTIRSDAEMPDVTIRPS